MQYLLSYISKEPYSLKINGKIIKELEWPNQRMAYPIKHIKCGYYKHIWFNAKIKEIKQLEKSLEKDQNLLRYLIVKDLPIEAINSSSYSYKQEKSAKIDDDKLNKKLAEILNK